MKKTILTIMAVFTIMSCSTMLILTGCSSGVEGKKSTSTATNGHSHTVNIPDSDFTNPPKEKIYTLSKGVDGHIHKIVLREVDFLNMNRGIDVTRPTSNASDGHSHEITIQ